MSRKSLSHLALSDDGFLFDSSSGNTFTLNSTATFILKKMIGGLGRDEIKRNMVEVYDASPNVVSRDFDQFFQYVVELDIVTDPEEEGNHAPQTT